MKNNNDKLEPIVINFSSYTKPQIIETAGRKWVTYGKDNDYFQYIIDRSNGSPTNNALITSIASMIFGKGVSAKDASQKPNEYAQMKKLFRDEDMRNVSYDLKLQGNAALQVIYSKDRKKIVQVLHIPVETLRAEKVSENGEIEGYYHSHDWTNPRKFKPIRYPAFGTSKEPLEILWIKPYKPGSFYYSPPDYAGGVTYAELEEEIANYHITNIQNGFSPTTLINFNNGQVSTNQEKAEIERKINNKFTGTGGAKLVLSFNNSKDAETTMETVQLSDAHEQYQFLSEEASKKILIAHKGFANLVGIEHSTGFGNNAEEIKNSMVYMMNKVISPFQELLIGHLDKILSYNEISLDLYFVSNDPEEWNTTEETKEGTEIEEPIN